MSDNQENKIENNSDLKNADEYVGDIGTSDKTLKEASTGALKKITDSVYNLASYKSAQAAVHVIDSLSLITMGIQEIDKVEREEIIKRLRQKGIVLREVSNDPEVKEIVRSTSKSAAKMIEIFVESTREPLTRVAKKTFDQLKGSVLNSLDEMADFGKNIVKIIPGIGDAYIIIDNVLSVGKVGTNVAKDNAVMIQNILETGKEMQERLVAPIKSEVLNVTDQMIKFKDAQERISKKIEDTGDSISNQIYPYPKEESKEETKEEELKDKPKEEESKEESKEETKEEESKEESKDKPKEEESKEESKDKPKEEESKEESKEEESKEESKEEESKDKPKDESTDKPKEETKEELKDKPKEETKDKPKDKPKDKKMEGGKQKKRKYKKTNKKKTKGILKKRRNKKTKKNVRFTI